MMGIMELLIFLILIGLAFWVVKVLGGTFGIPPQIIVVIQVVLVVIIVIYLIQFVGGSSTLKIR